MALSHSPKTVTDGLVFMYDTGNKKSYKGEPTINLATDSPSQGGWSGGREVLDSSKKKFKLIVNNFNGSAGSGQGWRSFTWDLNSYSGQSVTISATVEVPSASPGTFAWIMMGQGNTHTNSSGAGGYMGYSAASERVQKTTTTTEHITWTGTVGSTGTASQPSGHVGFTLWYNGGTSGVDSYVEVSNVQIEIKSHATQFVNGTRSATQGLIDRAGNSTIDLSNTSFDSDAQITLDGTDEYIDLGSDVSISPDNQGWTTEYWFNTNSASTLQHFNSAENDEFNANWLAILSSKLAVWNRSPGYWKYGSTQFSSNTWYQAVFICDAGGTNMRFYVNGEAEGGNHVGNVWTASYSSLDVRYIGKYEHAGGHSRYFNGEIGAVKIYDRALTAAEVLQNYNAIKSRFGL